MSHWKIINYMSILFMVHYFLGSSRCLIYKICSRHDIAEILLKLALNTNQSINQSLFMVHPIHLLFSEIEHLWCIYYFGFIGNLINQFVRRTDLNIFYCLNNDKRIRHKFFNLVLSSPYTYNIQYTI